VNGRLSVAGNFTLLRAVGGGVCLFLCCCAEKPSAGPQEFLHTLQEALASRDLGQVMLWIDGGYQDSLGGRGRLEDDLRQLITVYGQLRLSHRDTLLEENSLQAFLELEGPRLRYSGPQRLGVGKNAAGWTISSGVLEGLRGILDTLRERRLALEEGSTARMSLVVSEEYRGAVGGKKELLEQLRRDFELGPRALMVDKLSIDADEHQAQVTASYLLVVLSPDKKLEYRGRERLVLKYEAGRWRIAAGLA
jgi:hypothetical protein